MKFLLSMIICSSVYQQCLAPFPMPDKYNSHYECMLAGYEESITKAKEIGSIWQNCGKGSFLPLIPILSLSL